MRWFLVGMVSVAACTQWLGLDSASNNDKDGDHVPDSVDNCPSVPNPDQSDIDGNGIGDACDFCGAAGGSDDDDDGDGIPNECDACDNRLPDNNHDGVPDACEMLNDAGVASNGCPNCAPCALGPAHDEDGDLIADACDLCPIDGMRNSADTDGDGVGDACEATSGLPSHQIFDGFGEANQDWYQIGTAWSVLHDNLRAQPQNTTNYRFLGAGAGHFVIRTHLTLASSTNTNGYASTVALRGTPSAPEESIDCALISDPNAAIGVKVSLTHQTANGVLEEASLMVATTSKYQLKLDYDTVAGVMTCVATPASMPPYQVMLALTAPTTAPFQTGLGARGGGVTLFEYFQMASDF